MGRVTMLSQRIEATVRAHALIEPGGTVTCMVSGGADSTCLWHGLRALGYDVAAVHVNHGLRGGASDDDARHCRTLMGAEVIDVEPALTEAALRDLRYSATAGLGLRATGHTASDQVETVLYRLVSSGNAKGIRLRREDGVVRPLLDVTREETAAYCSEHGLAVRADETNPDTSRGLIRNEILPLLRRLHPGADANLLALADERPRLPRALEASLVDLLGSRAGSKAADLGGGLRAVREYGTLRLEAGGRPVAWGPWSLSTHRDGFEVRARLPRGLEASLVELLSSRAGTKAADLGGGLRAVREYGTLRLEGSIAWGPWTLESDRPDLEVRARRPGDHLAGRRKKVQDLLVDAKVPRAERATWPVVTCAGEVVAVPGIATAPGWAGVVTARRGAA